MLSILASGGKIFFKLDAIKASSEKAKLLNNINIYNKLGAK